MKLLTRLLEPKAVAYAHCDLPCGVYDPAQARIEAESIKGIDEKYQQNTDPAFRTRALIIKEQRSAPGAVRSAAAASAVSSYLRPGGVGAAARTTAAGKASRAASCRETEGLQGPPRSVGPA